MMMKMMTMMVIIMMMITMTMIVIIIENINCSGRFHNATFCQKQCNHTHNNINRH